MPLARILRLSGSHRRAPLQTEAFTDRPEPPLAARGGDDKRRRIRHRLVRRSSKRPASFTASSPPGTTGTCETCRRISSRDSCSRTSAPRPARPSSSPTAIRSATAAGCGCTTASSGDFRRIKRDLMLRIDPALYPEIEGSTDSELFFFLALTLGLEDDPPAAVEQAVGVIEHVGAQPRRRPSDPDDRGDERRAERLGFPILKRGEVPLAVLLDRREHSAPSASRQPGSAPALGRVETRCLGAARRPCRSMERGSRVELRHCSGGAGRTEAVQPSPAARMDRWADDIVSGPGASPRRRRLKAPRRARGALRPRRPGRPYALGLRQLPEPDALHGRPASRCGSAQPRRRADDLPAECVPNRKHVLRLEPGESFTGAWGLIPSKESPPPDDAYTKPRELALNDERGRHPRCHRRGWIRRGRLRQRACRRTGRTRHAARPERLPPVPAPPLSGRDRGVRPAGHRFQLEDFFPDHANIEVRNAEVVSADPQARGVTLADKSTIEGDVVVLASGSSRTSSIRRARRNSPSRCIRSTTPSGSARASASCSRTRCEAGAGRAGCTQLRRRRGRRDGGQVGGRNRGTGARRHAPRAPATRGRGRERDPGRLRPHCTRAILRRSSRLRRKAAPPAGCSVQARRVRQGGRGRSRHPGRRDDDQYSAGRLGRRLMAAPLSSRSGLVRGAAGLDVRPDLTVAGFPGVYALGDVANPVGGSHALPQLGSVAQQAGDWAARNILAGIDDKAAQPFHYHDKGIMAMIGRKAAVAEVGEHRHELHGRIAFAAWLGCTRSCSQPGAEVRAFLAGPTTSTCVRTIARPRCSTRRRSTHPASTGAPADPSRLLGVHGVQPSRTVPATRVPKPGSEWTVSSPPTAAIRLCIVVKPMAAARPLRQTGTVIGDLEVELGRRASRAPGR